jgi:hypothetical protein
MSHELLRNRAVCHHTIQVFARKVGRLKVKHMANGTTEIREPNGQPPPEEPFIDPLTNPIHDPLTDPIVDPMVPSLPPDDIPPPPSPSPGPTIPIDPDSDIVIDPLENPDGVVKDPGAEPLVPR